MNKYKAIDVANYIIWSVNKNELGIITPLKLHKILYYVYTAVLKKHNTILFPEQFQKWQFGPVVKEIYHEFKTHGINHISTPKTILTSSSAEAVFGRATVEFNPNLFHNDVEIESTIITVVSKLSKMKAFDLVEMTHEEDAWKNFENDIMAGVKELTYTLEELKAAKTI
jgi:uncharacterized phage-associated protein